MDDVLQIHIKTYILVCNTTTADVPTLYALVPVCALSVLKNKD